MKKIIIALACMLLGITGMQAQEFTLEYNIGYGLYNMSEMKDFLSNAAGSSLKGVKTTDKFPGWCTDTAASGRYHFQPPEYKRAESSGRCYRRIQAKNKE